MTRAAFCDFFTISHSPGHDPYEELVNLGHAKRSPKESGVNYSPDLTGKRSKLPFLRLFSPEMPLRALRRRVIAAL
jgi:hypothetical protein